jgi:hypothetical protein
VGCARRGTGGERSAQAESLQQGCGALCADATAAVLCARWGGATGKQAVVRGGAPEPEHALAPEPAPEWPNSVSTFPAAVGPEALHQRLSDAEQELLLVSKEAYAVRLENDALRRSLSPLRKQRTEALASLQSSDEGLSEATKRIQQLAAQVASLAAGEADLQGQVAAKDAELQEKGEAGEEGYVPVCCQCSPCNLPRRTCYAAA